MAALAVRSLAQPADGGRTAQLRAPPVASRPRRPPGSSASGALGMVVNFSTLVLFLPALRRDHPLADRPAGRSVTFAILFLITLLPVLAPVGLVTVLGPRADRALAATRAFVTRHSRRIGIGIEAVFAVYLVVKGVDDLP